MIKEAKKAMIREAKTATEPEAEDCDEGTYERIPTISSDEDLGTISQVTGVTSPTCKNERKDREEDAEA